MGFLKKGNLSPKLSEKKGEDWMNYIPVAPNPVLPTKAMLNKWKKAAMKRRKTNADL